MEPEIPTRTIEHQWDTDSDPEIKHMGSITIIDMTDEELDQAAVREKTKRFGFQASTTKRGKR